MTQKYLYQEGQTFHKNFVKYKDKCYFINVQLQNFLDPQNNKIVFKIFNNVKNFLIIISNIKTFEKLPKIIINYTNILAKFQAYSNCFQKILRKFCNNYALLNRIIQVLVENLNLWAAKVQQYTLPVYYIAYLYSAHKTQLILRFSCGIIPVGMFACKYHT